MTFFRRLPALLFCSCVLLGGAGSAAEKVYEQPSAFLTRHFGKVPETRILPIDSQRQQQLSAILGHRYGQKQVRYWSDNGKSAWILDEIGKTEPISTGFIVRGGKISEMKVLIYRESHGWEVSRPFFTKQFEGKSLSGTNMNQPVDGIVGATLSVRALSKLGAAALYLSQESAQ
jgi:hypothetical protein